MNFSANKTSTTELVSSHNTKFGDDRKSIDLDSLLESEKNTINDQLNSPYLSKPRSGDPEMGNSSSTSEFNGE